MKNQPNLTTAEVARKARCHTNTVRNYAKRGYIKVYRDHNNFRRFTEEEAKKLRELLEHRVLEEC